MKTYPPSRPSPPPGRWYLLSDRPTDVIQRRLIPPSTLCKTIRLRSHCRGSHYLALSIGETIFGMRTNTSSRPESARGRISLVVGSPRDGECERVRGRRKGRGVRETAKWPRRSDIFRMARPDANTRFFPRKSRTYVLCARDVRGRDNRPRICSLRVTPCLRPNPSSSRVPRSLS